ncbi:MAG: formylglycine-generating enzyme family protein [Bacteroidia bacterium]|nr:formylglycine-generating enzyme family protein [Bacteroidia bacterium]MBP9689380.1 formylglycine-generating enzyme family protein [Bacteroidia bacterium]
MLKHLIWILVGFCGFTQVKAQEPTQLKKIKGGTFVPLYGVEGASVKIADFLLDEYPVTNKQYLDFVKKHPEWQKKNVKKIFADNSYLRLWKNDTTLASTMLLKSPVTLVSWYAAKAYCACQGKRLPTMNEWEYVAMASEKKANAQTDSLFNQRIITSYEKPKTSLLTIGSTYKNYYNVWDMHGLVWEWTSDFNSVMISGESRKDGDTDRQLFCAAGSVNANDLMNYAAFMRYAFRGSIKANFNIQNLGFRCAQSIKK